MEWPAHLPLVGGGGVSGGIFVRLLKPLFFVATHAFFQC